MVSCKRIYGKYLVSVCGREFEYDTWHDAFTFIKYVRGYF